MRFAGHRLPLIRKLGGERESAGGEMHGKGSSRASPKSISFTCSQSVSYTRPSMKDGAHALAEHTRGHDTRGGVCVLREKHHHADKSAIVRERGRSADIHLRHSTQQHHGLSESQGWPRPDPDTREPECVLAGVQFSGTARSRGVCLCNKPPRARCALLADQSLPSFGPRHDPRERFDKWFD